MNYLTTEPLSCLWLRFRKRLLRNEKTQSINTKKLYIPSDKLFIDLWRSTSIHVASHLLTFWSHKIKGNNQIPKEDFRFLWLSSRSCNIRLNWNSPAELSSNITCLSGNLEGFKWWSKKLICFTLTVEVSAVLKTYTHSFAPLSTTNHKILNTHHVQDMNIHHKIIEDTPQDFE